MYIIVNRNDLGLSGRRGSGGGGGGGRSSVAAAAAVRPTNKTIYIYIY
jgi:hypothetical protein